MISDRFANLPPENQLSALLRSKRQQGTRLLDLTESNPTRAGFRYDSASILGSLAQDANLDYDPSPWGLAPARKAIAEYYRGRGCELASERILLTPGTSEGYSYLFKILTNPGDLVLAPAPSYPLFEHLARAEAIHLESYRLEYDGRWHIDLESLTNKLTPSAKAILLINPNNPTGSYLDRGEWLGLCELSQSHGIPLICDEVFFEYAFPGSPAPFDPITHPRAPLAFFLNGISKMAGLPQMKLGWIAITGDPDRCSQASSALELVADTFLSVSTPAQNAAPVLLETARGMSRQIRDRCRRNRDNLHSALTGTAASVLHTEGGWYAVVQVPRTRSEEEWVLGVLERQNVLVHPGFFYDFDREAFLIISLLPREETFQQSVQRIRVEIEISGSESEP